MREDLADCGPHRTIVVEECKDQVFELLRKFSAVCFLEVEVCLLRANEIVEVLFFARFLKRKDALNNDEEDHTERKHIGLKATVSLALFDLRGHISEGATVATEASTCL